VTSSNATQSIPWHLRAVAILTLVWNGSGAVTIALAQMGNRLDMDPNEVAYYASQPLWFTIATDVATVLPVLAGVALLLRSVWGVWLFALALAAIAATNAYDIAARTSLLLVDQGWRTLTVAVVAITLLQLAYAWTMKQRGVLR
jgi:hypothetical protein